MYVGRRHRIGVGGKTRMETRKEEGGEQGKEADFEILARYRDVVQLLLT